MVSATRGAIATPMQVMEATLDVFPLALALIKKGNQNALSDATVSALTAETAARGAYLNVLINLPGLPDETERKTLREKAEGLLAEAEKGAKAALRTALKKL